jgi:3-mercaptopyruvate sulfurtransferase SseA
MIDFCNIDNAKSYATEANLMKALTNLGLDKMRPIVVCNREGRFTAIFGLHLSGMAETGNVMAAAHHGFKTVN